MGGRDTAIQICAHFGTPAFSFAMISRSVPRCVCPLSSAVLRASRPDDLYFALEDCMWAIDWPPRVQGWNCQN